MKHSRESLLGDLRTLGVEPGDLVMMHASLRAIGPIVGGPDELWRAVVDACEGGAAMMYVGCPDGYDDIGRNIFSPEDESRIRAHLPPFDFQNARAQYEFGALAELFRSAPGTLCSEHVTRFAARGAKAQWLLADQPWDYSYGAGSPLAKLSENGGKILLLGSHHDEVTFLHHAEHVADFPGKRVVSYQVPLLENGERIWRSCEEFNTGGDGVHPNWPENFFEQIVTDFIARAPAGACRSGRVGGALSYLMSAPALAAHAIPIMVARANQPPAEAQ